MIGWPRKSVGRALLRARPKVMTLSWVSILVFGFFFGCLLVSTVNDKVEEGREVLDLYLALLL